jgi:hypothetical protein
LHWTPKDWSKRGKWWWDRTYNPFRDLATSLLFFKKIHSQFLCTRIPNSSVLFLLVILVCYDNSFTVLVCPKSIQIN